jgi:hypothetical protein
MFRLWSIFSIPLYYLVAFTTHAQAPLVSQFGPHFYAIENLDRVGGDEYHGQGVLRGKTTSLGFAHDSVILAPNTRYREWILQPQTLQVAVAEFVTPASGQRFQLPQFVILPTTSPDQDQDGLHAQAEFILGTDGLRADSDGDGIRDGVEIQQGSNPLDGRPVVTGVIAAADTPGIAVDVSALNGLAAVADSAAGVAIFDVRGINPILAAQVDTPGTALRVAWSGTLVVVADGPGGLAIIETSDPSSAQLIRQVPVGNVTAVAAAGGLAYAGLQAGQVAVIDITTGTVLQRVNVGAPIHDLGIEGGALFVLLPGQLKSFFVAASRLEPMDDIVTSGFPPEGITGSKRLFVGGGVAYVTSYPGFDTINVSDPADMRSLGPAVDRGANSFKHIVANGSGLGLAAVGVNPRNDGTHDLYLYDLSNLADTTRLVTTFVTPDIARAVSVFNGLAYVADSAAGLQVVNYRAFDSQGQPPTISLAADFPLNPAQAEEGKLVRVTAAVTDDVQVRSVEFYINGVLAVADGNFPFEHRFITPQRTASSSSFTVRAVAFDTGGNRAETPLITVQLVPDATPPRLTGQSPDRGQIVGSTDTIAAFFNEPINPATLSPLTFVLTFAGSDAVFGNADDSIITGGTLEYRPALNGAFLHFPDPLPAGVYRPSVRPALADLAGNPLAGATSWEFLVLGSEDADLDGVPDNVEGLMGLDPNNPDSDGDGILDGDEDPDSDGVRTSWELAYGFDPRVRDTNGDGIDDGDEDPDNDRLTSRQEQTARTNPVRSDTDGDGWSDEAEVSGQGDPLDPNIGPRLFLVAGPTISALVTGPNAAEATRVGTVAAHPPLSVLVSGTGVIDSIQLGTVVARPPVGLLAPGSGPFDAISLATVVARPPVTVLGTGVGPLELLNSLGTLIAQPPVNVLVPGTGPASEVPFGLTLALPPVSVRINPE